MPRLSLDLANYLFRSTVPGVEIIEEGYLADSVVSQVAAKESIKCIRFYDFRLSTSVREIGGWTFISENDFLNEHVARIFLVWLHYGQTDASDPYLLTLLRHCFKRFYADASVGEHSTRFGRAMLFESVIFERELLRPMYDSLAQDPQRSQLPDSVANCARVIARWHEIGHIRVQQTGLAPLSLVRELFEGAAYSAVKQVVDDGNHQLAEELYCDLFALQEVVQSSDSPLSLLDYASRFKVGLFCFLCSAFLSTISFIARLDARDEHLRRPDSKYHDNEFSDLLDATLSRARLLEDVIEHYSVRKGFHLYGAGESFSLIARLSEAFEKIYHSFMDASDKMQFGLTLCDQEYRTIADYLAFGQSNSQVTGLYLLTCSRDFGTLELAPEEEFWQTSPMPNDALPDPIEGSPSNDA
jgi:hypothetical protein